MHSQTSGSCQGEGIGGERKRTSVHIPQMSLTVGVAAKRLHNAVDHRNSWNSALLSNALLERRKLNPLLIGRNDPNLCTSEVAI
jgi:hypothetical protein